MLTAYKCTRPDGTDHRTGTVNYRDLLLSGTPLIHPNPDPPQKARTGDTCGQGYHVSPTPLLAASFGDRSHRPFAWFEIAYEEADVIEADAKKTRLRGFQQVVRELTMVDVFGADFANRVAAVREEILTWKSIPWLKPQSVVGETQVAALFEQWRAALTPWCPAGKVLPSGFRIVDDAADAAIADADADADAAAAAIADADAAAIADADAAAIADTADAAIADAADAAIADAAAAADAADADAAIADTAAAIADAAAAADADADAALNRLYWGRYYLRPYRCLRTHARWKIAGLTQPCPTTPLIELYRLGCWPIGFVNGEMVVFVPSCEAKSKRNGNKKVTV